MASIYEIENWASAPGTPAGTILYNKNDIVRGDNSGLANYNKYFYAIIDIVAENNYGPQGTNFPNGPIWGGHTTYNNKTVPHFFWIPSYAPSINSEPTVNIVKFGDGYEQRSPENINSNLLKVSLSFDKRDEAETKAISHFLHQRGAQEAFAFTPPSPYGSMKKFVCRSWDVTMNFQNNYSISATFEEVVD